MQKPRVDTQMIQIGESKHTTKEHIKPQREKEERNY